MLSASDEIRSAIAGADNVNGVRAIPFERFMDLALYGEGGFYTSGGGSAGRRGDFITSPEVGPLFGAVLARWLDATWIDLGRPEPFRVIEAGAGPGTLARTIASARPQCTDVLDYVAVEHSAEQRQRHPNWVTSSVEMPNGPITGVVVANELLDNLPFRLFVMDGGWREAFVIAQPDGTFAEILRPTPDVVTLGLPATAPHGARVPVQQRAGRWLLEARGRLDRGRVLVIDYASASTAGFATRPWRDWLRTYRGHQRGEHYLRSPGAQDITCEVAIDQLVAGAGEPDTVRPQAQFLARWGIDELVDEGRQLWAEQAARPTVAAMMMRSRVREAEALCDPAGLGAFAVLEFIVR